MGIMHEVSWVRRKQLEEMRGEGGAKDKKQSESKGNDIFTYRYDRKQRNTMEMIVL